MEDNNITVIILSIVIMIILLMLFYSISLIQNSLKWEKYWKGNKKENTKDEREIIYITEEDTLLGVNINIPPPKDKLVVKNKSMTSLLTQSKH